MKWFSLVYRNITTHIKTYILMNLININRFRPYISTIYTSTNTHLGTGTLNSDNGRGRPSDVVQREQPATTCQGNEDLPRYVVAVAYNLIHNCLYIKFHCTPSSLNTGLKVSNLYCPEVVAVSQGRHEYTYLCSPFPERWWYCQVYCHTSTVIEK